MYLWEIMDLRHVSAAAVIIVLGVTTAGAGQRFVSDQATFQAALGAFQANNEDDTITVLPGTFNLTFPLTYVLNEAHSLTVQGAGPNQTIIDGGGLYRPLSLDARAGLFPQAALSVSGITFRNGVGSNSSGDGDGGGLLLQTAVSTITVQNCDFVNNVADDDGGGLSASTDFGGTILVENSTFTGNRALGTDFLQGGVCFFQDGEGGGAKLGAEHSEVILRNNLFSANRSEVDGAGAVISETTFATVVGNVFTQNVASLDDVMHSFFTGEGGGLEIRIQDRLELRDNIFIGNLGFDGGGAVLEEYEEAVVVNNVFLNNIADGGVPFAAGNGGGLAARAGLGISPVLVITNNTFYGNFGRFGGGLYYEQNAFTVVSITNNIIWGNTAPEDIWAYDDADFDDIGGVASIDYNDIGGFFSLCDSRGPAVCTPTMSWDPTT